MEIKFAELTNGSIKQRPPGRLKFADIVLLKGASRVDPFALKAAPPGSTFTLESQTGGDPLKLAELRAAMNGKESFNLELTGTPNAVTLKVEWLVTIKQKRTGAGFGIEIGLRKG